MRSMIPKLHKWSGDIELIVRVLHGLTSALAENKVDRASVVLAIDELFPKMSELVPNLNGTWLANLHNLLCKLVMYDKVQAILTRVAVSDARRFTFKDMEALSGLTSIMRFIRRNNITTNTPHYRQFVTARIERYLWWTAKPEPSTSIHRAMAGCGTCAPCEDLDRFLASDQKQIVFRLSTDESRHIINQVQEIPDYYRDYDRDPYKTHNNGPLTLTKKVHTAAEHSKHMKEWQTFAKQARICVFEVAKKPFLREVLGEEKYEDILHLKGLRLVRDAKGKEIGLGPWSRVTPVSQPTALSVQLNPRNATARQRTTFSEIVMHHDASLKRKIASDADADADQENNAPPAKRSLVIDLGSDDDDD